MVHNAARDSRPDCGAALIASETGCRKVPFSVWDEFSTPPVLVEVAVGDDSAEQEDTSPFAPNCPDGSAVLWRAQGGRQPEPAPCGLMARASAGRDDAPVYPPKTAAKG